MHALTSLMHYSCIEHMLTHPFLLRKETLFNCKILSLSYSHKILPVCLYFWCGQFATL